VDIRLAGIRDAAAIAFVQVQSWKAIYRELVPQGDLDRLVVGHRCSVWEAVMRESNWQHRTGTLLAEKDKTVVGLVSIGAVRDDGATRVAAVRALHMLEDAWDTTAGKQLMTAALDSLSQTRFEHAVVWVLEADKRARDLYEGSGWREDGATRVRDQQAFAVTLAEVRYRHALR